MRPYYKNYQWFFPEMYIIEITSSDNKEHLLSCLSLVHNYKIVDKFPHELKQGEKYFVHAHGVSLVTPELLSNLAYGGHTAVIEYTDIEVIKKISEYFYGDMIKKVYFVANSKELIVSAVIKLALLRGMIIRGTSEYNVRELLKSEQDVVVCIEGYNTIVIAPISDVTARRGDHVPKENFLICMLNATPLTGHVDTDFKLEDIVKEKTDSSPQSIEEIINLFKQL